MISTKKQFQQLRLKLTLIYAVIGFFVIICFNFAVIWIFETNGHGFRLALNNYLADERANEVRVLIRDRQTYVNSVANRDPNFQLIDISPSNQLGICPVDDGSFFNDSDGFFINDQYRAAFDLKLQNFSQNFRRALFVFDFILLAMTILLGYYYSDYVLKPVERSLKKQEDFILDASHELKTPIATILAEIEALKIISGCSLNTEVCETLDVIEAETRNLHHLSQSMLDLSKINDEQPRLTVLDLSAICYEQLKKYKSRMKQKGINLIVEIQPRLEIAGIRHQLNQLIDILLDNAVKYTPTAGEVRFTLIEVKKEVHLIVKDSGVGVKPSDHQRIFQRFYRAKNKATFTEEGSGLGLSIAAQIVDYHRGQIKVQSDPDRSPGTCFIIIFSRQSHLIK